MHAMANVRLDVAHAAPRLRGDAPDESGCPCADASRISAATRTTDGVRAAPQSPGSPYGDGPPRMEP